MTLARARLDRPSVGTGDAGADGAMAASLLADAPEEMRLRAEAAEQRRALERHPESEMWQGFGSWVTVRTTFFDEAVLRAITDGRHQVLLLGAGYDMRAHRFRTPGIRFVEVDHPATQADKRRRLDRLGIESDDIGFVAADFIESGLDARLEAGVTVRPADPVHPRGRAALPPGAGVPGAAGDAGRPGGAGQRVGGQHLLSATGESDDQAEVRRTREERLAESGEAVLTVPPREVALRWLEAAGWTTDSVADLADLANLRPDAPPGRLLVRAHP